MMTPLDAARIEPFITRWKSSDGADRANYQMFFAEMTDALGVGRPYPQGQIPDDPYWGFCTSPQKSIFHIKTIKTQHEHVCADYCEKAYE